VAASSETAILAFKFLDCEVDNLSFPRFSCSGHQKGDVYLQNQTSHLLEQSHFHVQLGPFYSPACAILKPFTNVRPSWQVVWIGCYPYYSQNNLPGSLLAYIFQLLNIQPSGFTSLLFLNQVRLLQAFHHPQNEGRQLLHGSCHVQSSSRNNFHSQSSSCYTTSR
jgi:hypothetical protein